MTEATKEIPSTEEERYEQDPSQGQSLEEQWQEALSQQKEAGKPETKTQDVKPASFDTLKGQSTGSIANIEMILDIPVTVSVELGRCKMIVNDILQLGQGSVIELDKLAGEPMEILINGKLIARGEVVVVNEKFGIRLTDIISPTERIKQLG